MEQIRPKAFVSSLRRRRRSFTLLIRDRYWSVRIDAVHYCDKEQRLAEKRKRGSFLSRNADPTSAPQERLRHFQQTVRNNENLAMRVHFLKIAYMTRETCKNDLARAVSALPNLRYVDVPEGFYSDDPTCRVIRGELQNRCPEIRKMKYRPGSEDSFTSLASGRFWQNIDALELSNLNINPNIFLAALASLPVLHSLTISNFDWLEDAVFQRSPGRPVFPPLQTLSLTNTPNITEEGLKIYLARPEVCEVLESLSLDQTGVEANAVHAILAAGPHLSALSITAMVSKPLAQGTPFFQSESLHELHYELTAPAKANALTYAPDTYYNHLIASLHASTLPNLSSLYVRSATFPESLLLLPPNPTFSGKRQPTFSQQIAIYSKGEDAMSWEFTSVGAPSGTGLGNQRLGIERPLSTLSIGNGMMAGGLAPVLGGGARKSVFMTDGIGGFLAVPEGGTSVKRGDRQSWS